MANQNEIIKALKLIQQECLSHDDCSTCPLRDGDKMPACQIQGSSPTDWKIKDKETNWRAFN